MGLVIVFTAFIKGLILSAVLSMFFIAFGLSGYWHLLSILLGILFGIYSFRHLLRNLNDIIDKGFK